jgi:hypothetical protein
MKFSATGLVALIFLVATILSGIWLLAGGGPNGAGWVTGIAGGLFVVISILSRVLGGAWYTDNANGR